MTATSGMNIARRILHVGGRNNAAGYVEFGSIQAVGNTLEQGPPLDGSGTQENQRREAPCSLMKSR